MDLLKLSEELKAYGWITDFAESQACYFRKDDSLYGVAAATGFANKDITLLPYFFRGVSEDDVPLVEPFNDLFATTDFTDGTDLAFQANDFMVKSLEVFCKEIRIRN